MKSIKSLIFRVSLFAALFLFAIPASTQTCITCSCPGGVCRCPDCIGSDCEVVGCQPGFSCCPITACGYCQCGECNASRCLGVGADCSPDGCPFAPSVVENIDANNHLQAWMVDAKLPLELAAYSKTWSVVVARLQHDFSDTTSPLSSRRKLLLPSIAHLELGLPEYKQSVVVETKYSAQKGGWVFRLIRGLNGDQSRADKLVIMPRSWELHREEPAEHIGNGKITPLPNVIDFPTDANVEAQAAARLAKIQAAKEARSSGVVTPGGH
jgi:hypothetical protein